MRRIVCTSCLLLLLPVSSLAQNHDASIARIRLASGGGMCGGEGYCTSLTTVEPSFIVSELKDSSDPKNLPDRKQQRVLKKREWNKLIAAIDLVALAAVPSEKCYAFIDLPCSDIEIDFADGKKLTIVYDWSNVPPPVAAVLKSIPSNPMPLQIPPSPKH